MNVLVTGSTGFVGSWVCRELMRRGHRVTAVIEPGASSDRLTDVSNEIAWREMDLFRAGEKPLAELADGTDMAIHCAWYAAPGKYLISSENIPALAGTLNFFSVLWKYGCRRVVGVGTCLEYRMQSRPLREDDVIDSGVLYAAAKAATFLTGRELAKQMNGSFAWARLFYLYGPFEAPARLVPDLAANLLNRRHVPVTLGTQIRDYLHVEDVASALVEIGLSPVEGAVNVGSGKETTVRQMIETVTAQTGGADLVEYGARSPNLSDPPYVVADNRRLVTETAWRPRYTLETGITDTITWWRERFGLGGGPWWGYPLTYKLSCQQLLAHGLLHPVDLRVQPPGLPPDHQDKQTPCE